jgi:two-component system, OmpR family, copper resistance phosphate regulon response regulator CusR
MTTTSGDMPLIPARPAPPRGPTRIETPPGFRKTSVAAHSLLRYNVLAVVKVLIVEDEAKVALALRDGLFAEGYDVHVAASGTEGLTAIRSQVFDVIVLDLMLPGLPGLDVLAALRAQDTRTPVLILTARDTVRDRVVGLDGGADDYLVKPFAFAELLARVRALLRRGRSDATEPLSISDLEIDAGARRASRGGHSLALTAREFDLLIFLVRNRGQVVSRDQIAREVWNEPSRGTPLDNVIDVHMVRLRRKVDGDAAARLIHTVRGVGFVVREEEP